MIPLHQEQVKDTETFWVLRRHKQQSRQSINCIHLLFEKTSEGRLFNLDENAAFVDPRTLRRKHDHGTVSDYYVRQTLWGQVDLYCTSSSQSQRRKISNAQHSMRRRNAIRCNKVPNQVRDINDL